MRKFKFVGDPNEYMWDTNPIKDKIYDGDQNISGIGSIEHLFDLCINSKRQNDILFLKDWQEIILPTPNQDQPSSSMTKFEMAVFMVLQGLNANPEYYDNDDIDLIKCAVNQVKETFKQLENETNNSG